MLQKGGFHFFNKIKINLEKQEAFEMVPNQIYYTYKYTGVAKTYPTHKRIIHMFQNSRCVCMLYVNLDQA